MATTRVLIESLSSGFVLFLPLDNLLVKKDPYRLHINYFSLHIRCKYYYFIFGTKSPSPVPFRIQINSSWY